jgi:hypothetical protein
VNETAQILAKVSENWLNPQNPLREETIHALQVSTGFSHRQIGSALINCFEELTLPKITAYISSLNPIRRRTVGDIFHVLPSNVFTAWVHGAVITLLMGYRCLLKPSAREPVFARAWKKSLEAADPALAGCVEVVGWDENRLKDCQTVVAYGSDETLQKIRAQLPPGVKFVGYGHKLSVGVLFKADMDSKDLLGRVLRDVEPFRLQGCLSPQILYVEDPSFTRWRELEAMVEVMPKIRPFTQASDVLKEMAKFSPHLSCVGVSGSPDRLTFLERELKGTSASRVCPLGNMQRPPLSWKNGGIDLADLLN